MGTYNVFVITDQLYDPNVPDHDHYLTAMLETAEPYDEENGIIGGDWPGLTFDYMGEEARWVMPAQRAAVLDDNILPHVLVFTGGQVVSPVFARGQDIDPDLEPRVQVGYDSMRRRLELAGDNAVVHIDWHS